MRSSGILRGLQIRQRERAAVAIDCIFQMQSDKPMSETTAPPCDDLPSQPEEIFVRILDWRHLVRLYHPLRAVAPVWRAPVERLAIHGGLPGMPMPVCWCATLRS